MPSREKATQIQIADSITPSTLTAVQDGAWIDVSECDAATIVLTFGTTVDAGATYKIQSSPDASTPIDLTPVLKPELDNVLLGQPYATPVATEARRYAYVGNEQYIRLIVEGTVAGTDIHAQVIMNRLYEEPQDESLFVG